VFIKLLTYLLTYLFTYSHERPLVGPVVTLSADQEAVCRVYASSVSLTVAEIWLLRHAADAVASGND